MEGALRSVAQALQSDSEVPEDVEEFVSGHLRGTLHVKHTSMLVGAHSDPLEFAHVAAPQFAAVAEKRDERRCRSQEIQKLMPWRACK